MNTIACKRTIIFLCITLLWLLFLLPGCGGGFNGDSDNAKNFMRPLFKKPDTTKTNPLIQP
jgi:hypothetical protein